MKNLSVICKNILPGLKNVFLKKTESLSILSSWKQLRKNCTYTDLIDSV